MLASMLRSLPASDLGVSQIIMLQEFLQQYRNAVDLDDSQFDTHFPEGIQRSDLYCSTK